MKPLHTTSRCNHHYHHHHHRHYHHTTITITKPANMRGIKSNRGSDDVGKKRLKRF
jgi:hypothetical protein